MLPVLQFHNEGVLPRSELIHRCGEIGRRSESRDIGVSGIIEGNAA